MDTMIKTREKKPQTFNWIILESQEEDFLSGKVPEFSSEVLEDEEEE